MINNLPTSPSSCLDEACKLAAVLGDKFGIYPKVGVEIEFYLQSTEVDNDITADQILDFTKYFDKFGYKLLVEESENQFELVLDFSDKIEEFCQHIDSCKELLKKVAIEFQMEAVFPPSQSCYKTDAGIHFHLSLHNFEGKNIFAGEEVENGSMISKIAGSILDILQESIYYLCGDNELEYRRFMPSKTSPSTVSWGKNNRTVALRVPTSAIENKRLEFRVPSAAVSHKKVIFWLLFAVARAMHKMTKVFPIIYGDANDAQYAQESLPTSLKEAKEYDNFRKVYANTMKYFT